MTAPIAGSRPVPVSRWIKVLDQSRCIGCHACTTACKSENEVPLGVTRTYVKAVEVGLFPQVRRNFQVTRCNQCQDAPCVAACPTSAMYRRRDGIVDFDKSACIGCKACIAACPYDAIFINPDDHSAEKCNFCAHRLDAGLEPACVVVCPTQAILVGDIADPGSPVSTMVAAGEMEVRRPELGTGPGVYYRGATQATLDPLAARRPDGGLFMWSEQGSMDHQVTSGASAPWQTSAAVLLAYDVPHLAPWDWRVSLYTWTKGIASGVYLAALALLLAGLAGDRSPLWSAATPLIAGGFLGLTGLVLIWDLEHPARFLLIFSRPQWRSWLVRGAFIIAGYGLLLAAHLLGAIAGAAGLPRLLAILGAPLAVATAVYTGYLFRQARGRDLWQDPVLPAHLLVQSLLSGAAALLPPAALLEPRAVPALSAMLAVTAVCHLLLVAREALRHHSSAHARLAFHEMSRGRFRAYFRIGVVLVAASLPAVLMGPVAAPLALAGLLAHEHAHVQAGQSVPLA